MIVRSDKREMVYIVKWAHIRSPKVILSQDGKNTIPCSSMTSCEILDADTKQVYIKEFCFCHNDDQYNKDFGRKKSMTRAIQYFDRNLRRDFWNSYKEEIGFK